MLESSSTNGRICFAPSEQFNPTLKRFFTCEIDIQNASVVCPDKVLPLWSTIVPDIIMGRIKFFSEQTLLTA